MGLQKFRADRAGQKQVNGGTPFYTEWIGGPTLALIRDCKIENRDIPPRTVYVRGEPDTWFSIPAACKYRGKTVAGYIACDGDTDEYVFRAHVKEGE
jgi:hypothetical protein